MVTIDGHKNVVDTDSTTFVRRAIWHDFCHAQALRGCGQPDACHGADKGAKQKRGKKLVGAGLKENLPQRAPS